VNFDDPATYHLYYGDELGRPYEARRQEIEDVLPAVRLPQLPLRQEK
jgi:hypothetical protein